MPLADGTLGPTPGMPSDDLVPSLLATSDVLGTGWFAADAANVKPGSTVVVVGDGAVSLLGILSAKQMGAERIIAMSRHAPRQALAREFGATDIVAERGDDLLTGPECEVVRVRQHHRRAGLTKVVGCDPLDGRLRADRHENGRLHRAVRRLQAPQARGPIRPPDLKSEGSHALTLYNSTRRRK